MYATMHVFNPFHLKYNLPLLLLLFFLLIIICYLDHLSLGALLPCFLGRTYIKLCLPHQNSGTLNSIDYNFFSSNAKLYILMKMSILNFHFLT